MIGKPSSPVRREAARKRTRYMGTSPRGRPIRLAQRLQPVPTLLRTPRTRDRRLLRPRRRDHHCPSPCPAGLDHPPLGHPTRTTATINTSIRGTSKPRCGPTPSVELGEVLRQGDLSAGRRTHPFGPTTL